MRTATLLCLAALCACAAVGCAQRVKDWQKPDFCKERDCPRFETVEKADGYETRRYEKAWWVWVQPDERDMEEAAMKAVALLTSYFNGDNKEGKTFPMGTPLAHNVSRQEKEEAAGADSVGRRRRRDRLQMTVKAFLPYNFQDGKEKPPEPNNEEVKIDEFPEWTAHVRGFDGFPTRRRFEKHAKALIDALEDDDKDYSDDWGVFSIYNPPTEIEDRYNEVLFPAETGKKTANVK